AARGRSLSCRRRPAHPGAGDARAVHRWPRAAGEPAARAHRGQRQHSLPPAGAVAAERAGRGAGQLRGIRRRVGRTVWDRGWRRMSGAEAFCLYDAEELEAVLADMARQLAARLQGRPFVMVGILRRGEPLARMLQRHYASLSGEPVPPLYGLKVQRYADDLSLLHPATALSENPALAALDLAATPLLVVDDVLYEGHSLLRTCAYLAQLGATEVHTAVLVDRHAYRQPVRADIVGVHLQVPADDVVECHVPPYEDELRIEVWRHGATH